MRRDFRQHLRMDFKYFSNVERQYWNPEASFDPRGDGIAKEHEG